MSHETIEAMRRTISDVDTLRRKIVFYQHAKRTLRRDQPKEAGLWFGTWNVEPLAHLPEEDRDRFWALMLPAANQFCDEMIAKHQKALESLEGSSPA